MFLKKIWNGLRSSQTLSGLIGKLLSCWATLFSLARPVQGFAPLVCFQPLKVNNNSVCA